jgi:hypothetical protein
MTNQDFEAWIVAGVAVADRQPAVRQLIVDTFGFMQGCTDDDEATRELSPILDEASDRVLAMIGPLAPGDGCLCCSGPARDDVALCEMCVQDHGTDPARWPAWIKRLADDRARRLATVA